MKLKIVFFLVIFLTEIFSEMKFYKYILYTMMEGTVSQFYYAIYLHFSFYLIDSREKNGLKNYKKLPFFSNKNKNKA